MSEKGWKPPQFHDHAPASVDEARARLQRYDGDAKLLAGGQFSPVVKERLPFLGEVTRWVGHLPIRTRATIGARSSTPTRPRSTRRC